MANVPVIIRETAHGAYSLTLADKLFAQREILLEGGIDRAKAMDTINQLRILAEEGNTPITLLINSPGGDVVSGFAIYDTMHAIPCDVRTICIGEASSMAAIILAGGTKGCRAMLPNSEVMIHDPILTGCGGPALTVEAISQRLMRTRRQAAQALADCTGRTVDEILEKTAKDCFFIAEEAVEFGLVDSILTSFGGDERDAG